MYDAIFLYMPAVLLYMYTQSIDHNYVKYTIQEHGFLPCIQLIININL